MLGLALGLADTDRLAVLRQSGQEYTRSAEVALVLAQLLAVALSAAVEVLAEDGGVHILPTDLSDLL